MIYNAIYNAGSAIGGTTQVGNIAVATGTPDYSIGDWTGGVDDTGCYLIISETTNTGLAGRTAGGTSEIIPADTPVFWRTTTDTDQSFLNLVNTLPGSPGTLTDVTTALDWLTGHNFWTSYGTALAVTAQIYFDPANPLSYPGSGNTLTNIGTLGNVTGTLGTMTGVVYDNAGGGSLNFDGGSDTIQFGQFNFGNSVSVSAWVYPRNEPSINTLISNCGANTATNGFKMAWNNWTTTNLAMNLEAGNGSAGGTQSTGNNTVVENEWQMLTYVFDKTNQTVRFYKNGADFPTISGGSPVANIGTNNANWWIGSIGGNSYQMDANLGEFKVWTSLISDGDVLAEFEATKARYGL